MAGVLLNPTSIGGKAFWQRSSFPPTVLLTAIGRKQFGTDVLVSEWSRGCLLIRGGPAGRGRGRRGSSWVVVRRRVVVVVGRLARLGRQGALSAEIKARTTFDMRVVRALLNR